MVLFSVERCSSSPRGFIFLFGAFLIFAVEHVMFFNGLIPKPEVHDNAVPGLRSYASIPSSSACGGLSKRTTQPGEPMNGLPIFNSTTVP
jgi:hypothetical protein